MLHDFLEIEFFPRFRFNGDQFMLEWQLMEVAVAEWSKVLLLRCKMNKIQKIPGLGNLFDVRIAMSDQNCQTFC